MFSGYWKLGINHTYRALHANEVTTVIFGNDGPIETKWKRKFSIFNVGFYWRQDDK